MTVYTTTSTKKRKIIVVFDNGDVYRVLEEEGVYYLGVRIDLIPESGYEKVENFPGDSLVSQHEALQRYRVA